MPASWKTTEVGFYEYMYVMIYDNSDAFVKNFRIYLGNKIYFAEQLTFDIHAELNSNTEDLNSGGIIQLCLFISNTNSRIQYQGWFKL